MYAIRSYYEAVEKPLVQRPVGRRLTLQRAQLDGFLVLLAGFTLREIQAGLQTVDARGGEFDLLLQPDQDTLDLGADALADS